MSPAEVVTLESLAGELAEVKLQLGVIVSWLQGLEDSILEDTLESLEQNQKDTDG